MTHISHSDVQKYHDDGVIILREFLSSDEVSLVNDALMHYVEEIVPRLPEDERVYESNASQLRNLFHMHVHDPFFLRFGTNPKLKSVVEALEGWHYELHYVESFLKPAKCGSEVPMHQDEPFLGLVKPQFVTAWFPLDQVDEGNGTLRFILGSHKWGRIDHDNTTIPGSQFVTANSEALKELPNVPAVMKPGDVALFNCRLLHYSLANTSDKSRRIIGVGMRGPEAGLRVEPHSTARIANSILLQDAENRRDTQ